jgi:hypothetical protein
MLLIISICLTALGLLALVRKNKVPAWCLLAAANGVSLADGIRRSDPFAVVWAAVALAIIAAYGVFHVLWVRRLTPGAK